MEDMKKYNVEVQRPWTITGFKNDGADETYPVEVQLKHVDGEQKETIRAKYLFGGEGARSFIREQLHIPIRHRDPIAYVWGVMDGVVRTDFPDIKVSADPEILAATTNLYSDEMHNPFRCWINYGHSTRRQYGSSLYTDCIID